MSFLNTFRQGIGELARAYLFYVKLIPPTGTSIQNRQKYLVKSSSIPASTIEEITLPFQGGVYKFAGTSTVEDWSCTFNSDLNMELRSSLLRWHYKAHNPLTNEHGNTSQYFGQVRVEMLTPNQEFGSGNENSVHEVILWNAWPKVIGSMDLGYDSKEISSFECTFAYNYIEIVKPSVS